MCECRIFDCFHLPSWIPVEVAFWLQYIPWWRYMGQNSAEGFQDPSNKLHWNSFNKNNALSKWMTLTFESKSFPAFRINQNITLKRNLGLYATAIVLCRIKQNRLDWDWDCWKQVLRNIDNYELFKLSDFFLRETFLHEELDGLPIMRIVKYVGLSSGFSHYQRA